MRSQVETACDDLERDGYAIIYNVHTGISGIRDKLVQMLQEAPTGTSHHGVLRFYAKSVGASSLRLTCADL